MGSIRESDEDNTLPTEKWIINDIMLWKIKRRDVKSHWGCVAYTNADFVYYFEDSHHVESDEYMYMRNLLNPWEIDYLNSHWQDLPLPQVKWKGYRDVS